MKKFLLIIMLLLFINSPGRAEADNMQLSVNPDSINIGLGFKGGETEISGRVPQGSDVYLKLQSASGTVPLNLKAKKGPLWITAEHVQAEGVPKVCKVLSSGTVAGLSPELSEMMDIDNKFYFVKRKARVTKKEGEKKEVLTPDSASKFLDGLVNIYKSRDLYAVEDNAVEVTGNIFRAKIAVPPEIPPGEAIITVFAVKDGKIIGTAQNSLSVKNAGMVGWARNEAITNGPMYGIIAVIIALIGGLGIGMIFNWLDKIFSGKGHKEIVSDTH